MPIQQIETRRLYAQIADQLSDLIKTGEFKAGGQLPSERELAEQLGVSRPTVREAIISLEVRGLVDVRVGVGIFVRASPGEQAETALGEGAQLGLRSPLEVIEARVQLEPVVAALAATRITAREVTQLRALLTDMLALTTRDVWSYANDRSFHETIARACGNQILSDMVMSLWKERDDAVSVKFDEHLSAMKHVRAHILDDHRRVVDALMHRDAEASSQAMRVHLDFVQAEMLRSWEQEQDGS